MQQHSSYFLHVVGSSVSCGTIPNCTEEQQYIIFLWSTILGNCGFHGRLSILVSKIPLLQRNLIQIWKFLGGGLEPPMLLPLLRAWRLSWIESTFYMYRIDFDNVSKRLQFVSNLLVSKRLCIETTVNPWIQGINWPAKLSTERRKTVTWKPFELRQLTTHIMSMGLK